mgnify:CR=1 FL=1
MSKYDKRNANELKIPFAYQQKAVLRFLQTKFTGKERHFALSVYDTITWIVSDFSNEHSGKIVHNWPRVVSTYSGIGKNTASKFIKKFKEFGIIEYEQEKNSINGRWNNWIMKIPATLPREVLSRVAVQPAGGPTMTGEAGTL